ncbi:MAG: glycosyltransferase [Actinomycetota bacterium]|nr:glycosyltransferase [Actinomycetota bacterium]
MRIAMVSEHANPLAAVGGVDAGGQNVHVGALARALAAQGHDVVVHSRRDAPSVRRRVRLCPGVVVDHVPAGPARDVPKDELLPHMAAFGQELARVWAADPPDVVHGHFWMSGLAALPAARGLGLPVVQTFHALGTVKRRHQGDADTSPPERLPLESAVARNVDRIIATCSDEVEELVRMGVQRGDVGVVPCGVDLGLFTDSGPALPRGAHRHRLVTVGRLVERKGVQTVIEALGALADTELLVAGGPPAERMDDDPDVSRLREVAGRYGVADRVTFLGRVRHEDIPSLLRSADVAITVPWYEPFGITPLEAMACGTPVVASAVGGLTDTVVDRRTGLLVPPRRPDLLAGALRALLGDRSRLRSFGRAAAQRARSRYSWDRIAAETAAVYRQVLEERAAAGTMVAVAR